MFLKNIRLLDQISDKPILIHMHLVGGDWASGMAIYDAIELCRSYVTIIVYGQAESMSSIILQAADKRVMTQNSYFMSHYGVTSNEGNYLDVKNWTKYEAVIEKVMMEIYASVAIKGKYFQENMKNATELKVLNYLRRKMKEGDWYLTSHETVYRGFADVVLGTKSCPNIESLINV
jgi:ATP-dependent protease ClpP protease subunit